MQANTVFGLNMCMNKATLGGFSGAAATFTAANPVVSCVGGKMLSTNLSAATAVTTDAITGVAFPAMAANKASVFVVTINGSGTKGVAQGSVVDLDASGNFKDAPKFPLLPDTLTALGYVVIKNGSTGSAWTFGTGNWNATGITVVTPVDVCTLPTRPQTS